MGASVSSQAARGGRRKSYKALAEINVTPLVDVMLVLLIVFMVTAPLLTSGVKVDLPQTKANNLTQSDEKPLEITIDAEGKIYLQETALTLDELVPKLTAISQANREARIFIRSDRTVPYGTVAQVLGAVTNAGYSKVALPMNLLTERPAQRRP